MDMISFHWQQIEFESILKNMVYSRRLRLPLLLRNIISRREPIISFAPDDSVRDLLGFNADTIYEEYNLSPNPVDVLSFDTIFPERDIAQRKTFTSKRSKILHKTTIG